MKHQNGIFAVAIGLMALLFASGFASHEQHGEISSQATTPHPSQSCEESESGSDQLDNLQRLVVEAYRTSPTAMTGLTF